MAPMLFKDEKLNKLVLWEDPKKSGAVLGAATVAYYVFEKSGYTLISIVANVLFLAVLVLALWTQAAKFMPNRSPPALPKLEISEALVRDVTEKSVAGLNTGLAYVYKLGTGKDIPLTLKALAVLYVAAQVGAFFHVLTLLYCGVLFSFVAPKVYQKYQTEIDEAMAKAHEQFEIQYKVVKEKVAEMIPKHKAAEVKKEE